MRPAEGTLRGKFEGVDLDELVDWPVVRTWLYWGMFWLMFAPTVGVSISTCSTIPIIWAGLETARSAGCARSMSTA